MFMGGQGQQGAQTRSRRGADMEASVTLEFKEAIFGTERAMHFNAEDRCDRCDGNGGEPGTKVNTCKTCNGAGHVTRVQQTILGAVRQTGECPTCHGVGKVPEKPCQKCRGAGTVKTSRELKVKIPGGIDNGSTLKLAGKGGADRVGPAGDLYVHVRVRQHPILHRSRQDIQSSVTVPMVQAALGADVSVETVDGDVTLKVPAGTQTGKVFKMSERGVPGIGGRRRGDHLVTVVVETPTKLSSKQKELLQQFTVEGGKKPFWKK